MHTLKDPRKAETYCDRQYDLATRNGETGGGTISRSGSSAFRPSDRLPRSLSVNQGILLPFSRCAAHHTVLLQSGACLASTASLRPARHCAGCIQGSVIHCLPELMAPAVQQLQSLWFLFHIISANVHMSD